LKLQVVWQDEIKIELKAVGWHVWSGLITPLASSCERGNKPVGVIKVGVVPE